jgi:hypothetical protein
MSRFGYTLAILASSVLASACTDDATETNQPPSGSTSGDESSTFDHDNSGISPWDLLERLQQEGPPTYTSRVHSCPKVRYKTLGTVLTSFGVNIANTTALSAGDLYRNGFNALGGANYGNRIRENISIATSGASREFDIFAAAAPEIIAAFTSGTGPLATRCPGAQLFDASNNCVPSGVTCLIGAPATSRHIDYCNLTVQSATHLNGNTSDFTTGKRLAVAALLAAAYTCE